jgi:general stress protein 26
MTEESSYIKNPLGWNIEESKMDRIALHSFMARHRLGVVSSIAEDGTPQSALVGIAITPQLEIIFDTVKSSRKYRNLIARPVCSFVVGWAGEQTVQLEGHALEPSASDLKPYQETYFTAWPESRAHMDWPDIAYFVVRPQWIRYSDYDHSPPIIEEITISG